MRLLPLDDAADFVQAAPAEVREAFLDLLDVVSKREVTALLAYSEDAAGGLMDPRFVRLRPGHSVDEAISYLRRQARDAVATLEYGYVLDAEQRLLGVVSLVRLLSSLADRTVQEVMDTNPITVAASTDQEPVSQLFRQHGLTALPVVDGDGIMKGVGRRSHPPRHLAVIFTGCIVKPSKAKSRGGHEDRLHRSRGGRVRAAGTAVPNREVCLNNGARDLAERQEMDPTTGESFESNLISALWPCGTMERFRVGCKRARRVLSPYSPSRPRRENKITTDAPPRRPGATRESSFRNVLLVLNWLEVTHG